MKNVVVMSFPTMFGVEHTHVFVNVKRIKKGGGNMKIVKIGTWDKEIVEWTETRKRIMFN